MDFGEVIGNRRYLLHGVGTSNFQNELELIVGRRTEQSAHHRATALLVPEPKNPYDSNAVGIEIEKYLVGHLDRQKAEEYLAAFGSRSPTPCVCQAVIVGGWHRDGDEDAYFGVRLDADMPFRLVLPPTFMRGLIFGDPRQGFASQLKQFVTALVAITGIIVLVLAPMVVTYNPPVLAGATTNPPASAAAALSSALANTPQPLPTMAEIQVAAMDGPKHDIRGFWPGMEEKEFKAKVADAALRCEPEQDATIDCKGSDGEYRFLFTREITPRLIKEVRLYFKSGAEPHEMAELLSQQFGAQPSERDETLGWPNPKQPEKRAMKQAENRATEQAVGRGFSAFGMRLMVAKWKLPGWNVLELSGTESYLLTLVSMTVIDREARARQERVDREENARRLLNAKPKF